MHAMRHPDSDPRRPLKAQIGTKPPSHKLVPALTRSWLQELINLTASFEAWVDELGITDVPFRQLGTALSSKLQNGALADWLGRGVQGLLNRLGLKGASFQPDIALLKKRLAAPGLADLLRSSLPTLFAELDVSDVTLREVGACCCVLWAGLLGSACSVQACLCECACCPAHHIGIMAQVLSSRLMQHESVRRAAGDLVFRHNRPRSGTDGPA